MVNQKDLFDALKDMGVDFFTGVPDSLLNNFCLYMVQNIPDGQHVMAANEGNAIGIAAGYYMATGKIPVVYMQNSGIGNATNPLLSLTHNCVYGIPMVLALMVSWNNGWVYIPPEKSLVRISLYVQIYISVFLIDPEKRLLILFKPYQLCVMISEGSIVVSIRER